jgi:hypothetical protein
MPRDVRIKSAIRAEISATVAHRRTICEVLREIWDIAGVLDETLRKELEVRVVDAYTMAKKMDRRLREYKYGWDEGFWQANEDYEADLKRRSGRG